MITSIIIKLFYIIIIILFLIGLFVPMIIIKKKGNDPHGTHESASLLTRLTSFTIFSWLLYIIAYIVMDVAISRFLAIDVLSSNVIIIIGFIIVSFGLLLDGWGTIALGSNFRIELPKEEISLTTTGIYGLMRNPIVMGVYLLLLGSFLIIPTVISLIFLITNVITFDSKIRDEEKFLSRQFGDTYKEYKIKVGRYLPFKLSKRE